MNSGDNLLLKQIYVEETYEWASGGKELCFLYLKEGKCKYLSNCVSQILSSGDWLVFDKGSGGKVDPLDKKTTTAVRFRVRMDQLGSVMGVGELGLLEKVSARLSSPRYYQAGSPVAQQCQALLATTPPAPGLEHRCHLLRIAAAILSEEFRLASNQGHKGNGSGNGNGDFALLLNRIRLEDLQNLSVEDLAKKLGYSRRHLNRLFHENLGTSVSALKMEVRLLKSLFLLQNPAIKVIDVALECGFNHLGLFSQCFKRRFAVSPNQWRHQELERRAAHAPHQNVSSNCELKTSGMCLWGNLQKSSNVPSVNSCCDLPVVSSLACKKAR